MNYIQNNKSIRKVHPPIETGWNGSQISILESRETAKEPGSSGDAFRQSLPHDPRHVGGNGRCFGADPFPTTVSLTAISLMTRSLATTRSALACSVSHFEFLFVILLTNKKNTCTILEYIIQI